MQIIPYLTFSGNCAEAIEFYQKAIDAKVISIQKYGEAPVPSSKDYESKIMHAILQIGGHKIMMSDGDEARGVNFGDNISVSVDCDTDSDVEKYYNAIALGGDKNMVLQETFWGARFGICTDKFGQRWMFNYDKPKK